MKRLIILILVASFTSFAGYSQPQSLQFDKTKLDAYFNTLASNNRFMGSVAVSHNGRLIYTKSVGYLDIEHEAKANEKSKYIIASISKTFTSVLIFRAIEENKLMLEQTIDKFFPAMSNANKITIGHLLYHRSGIPDYLGALYVTEERTKTKTENEMIEIMNNLESDFEPDTKTKYSNSNFILLTYILERVYQKSFAEIIRENIVKPASLNDTYLGKKINSKDNECYSYNYWEGKWHLDLETNISILLGAGGIISTPIDLTKFSDALFNEKLISLKSLEQMKTIKDRCEILKLELGMGLILMPFEGNTGYGHLGGIDGFRSIFAHFPGKNISIACISNSSCNNYLEIATVFLKAIFNRPFEIPEYKPFQRFNITDEDLNKYLGIYSNSQIPLDIAITKNNGKLFGQATGQSSFPLEATEQDKFRFEPAGIIIEFNPTDNTMVLKQSGGVFNFVKKD